MLTLLFLQLSMTVFSGQGAGFVPKVGLRRIPRLSYIERRDWIINVEPATTEMLRDPFGALDPVAA